MRFLLIAMLLTAAASMGHAGESRLSYGRIALDGNIESVVLDFGPLGKTSIRSDDQGPDAVRSRSFSNATISIPIPIGPERGSALVPTVTSTGGGQARYLGWERAPEPLPKELAQRSLPPVERPLPRPSLMGLLLLALSCAGTWLLWRSRRPRVALAVALASSACLAALGGSLVTLDRSQLQVIDFAAKQDQPASWQGIQTKGATESISFGSNCLTLEVIPQHSPLELQVPLAEVMPSAGTQQASPTWQAHAPRASRLWTRTPWNGSTGPWLKQLDGGELQQNLGDLPMAWLRTKASQTIPLGPMPAEQPPGTATATTPPPAWLIAALPMGQATFLARLNHPKTYLRATWTGLQPPTKSDG